MTLFLDLLENWRNILPQIQSAKKRLRQNDKRRTANREKRSAVRTAEKTIISLVREKKFEDAENVFRTYASLIDKASKTNIYHPNNASRKKSRLSKLIVSAKKAS